MLDLKFIRRHPEAVKRGAENKGVKVDIDLLLSVDEERRVLLQKREELKAEKNRTNDQIKKADKKEKKRIIEERQGVAEEADNLERKFKSLDLEFQQLMKKIPNLPLENVPVGRDDRANLILREEGKRTEFDFNPGHYLPIAEKLDIIDVKRAAKVSGSRFGYLKGEGALLEFALIQLVIKIAMSKNFKPIIPPVMIKPEMMEKIGFLERRTQDWIGDEVYFMKNDELVLVGSSEQSIGPMHADEIFQKEELPKRYLGFSSCFRREAGSYGKDTKGILRVHQFDKLEMFSFCLPEKSIEEHNLILAIEEDLMKKLGLPYRVVNICTGELGLSAAIKYDIEVWLPGQREYRETHSTSNCTDWQARRLNIRYQNGEKNEFVHMLNGTAIAIGRILIAIIENYQQKDGSVRIPEVLVDYLGQKEIKRKKND